jgi:hypothetical protein
MTEEGLAGWRKLLSGYPWTLKDGRYLIPAYSEYMPPPLVGKRPYGEVDASLFSDDDEYGWNISEVEEEYELRPGLANLARQIVGEMVELGQGKPAYRIGGHHGRNLVDNPYWPPELAARVGKLPHEKFVTILPLALSRTQDDKGRNRWTFFGGSEQGPERAVWESFYSSPGIERPPDEAFSFLLKLCSAVYGEPCRKLTDLHLIGFTIFPTPRNDRFPYWTKSPLPSSAQPFLWSKDTPIENTRYMLTFAPFSLLPEDIRQRYLSGRLVLLPFPGSLAFWGMANYIRLQEQLPLAMQLPLQRLVARHGGPEGIRVPQSGWFHESGTDLKLPEVHERFLLNTYRRTSRWDRAQRYENEVVLSTIEDTIGRILFNTELDILGLYGKPMARNSQVWTADSQLLLNGPAAAREDLEKAADVVARGGTFRYRFQFPPMQVGLYQVYWQRPLVAYREEGKEEVQVLVDGLPGYLTAYRTDRVDLADPVELRPKFQHRDAYLLALRNFEHLEEHYRHQTALNVTRLLDMSRRWGRKPVPRSLARQVLRLPEQEPLESWLAALPDKAKNRDEGERLVRELENRLEPGRDSASHTSLPGIPVPDDLPSALTYVYTARREFEEGWWGDIQALSGGKYANKNNADCIEDPPTLARLKHRHRDLERLGKYLLERHNLAIETSGMTGRAICGELRFAWTTDFNFSDFGGWKNNQEGHTYERDLLVAIPGKDRGEAVIMADHYDTAYMEDVYDRSKGGSGARIAAAGADDNGSATATLLQAVPIFLKMSKEGLLERDIWLVHLTGEEFPSDCMGARALCQALVENNLRIYLTDGGPVDLSSRRITGAYVLDMIGHNRDNDMDVFQISPGKGRKSLQLAYQAHLANITWNIAVGQRNRAPERRGKGQGRRSSDGIEIPPVAEFPRLRGELRLIEDPHSSLYNTDGQIFSDCGIPVVLLMENYDISRSGYHDTKDTMADIDLDYGAGLAAISIEAVARAATRRR